MRNKKLLTLILILVLLISVFTGCKSEVKEGSVVNTDDKNKVETTEAKVEAEDEYGITIEESTVKFVDGRGEELVVEKNPERVIVLFASFVDIWTRNGGKLVGMVEDSSENIIPGTENVETVGKLGSISLEKVIALQPDLVVLSNNSKSQRDLIPALEENNIQVIALDYQFKEDYFKISKIFSAINNRKDLYEEGAQTVKEQINETISMVPNDEPKILIMFATAKSLTAMGSKTTLGEMLKDLGTLNIADNSNDTLSDKNFSLEKIIEEDPDFIFVQTMGSDDVAIAERIKSDAESNPAWSSLSAVKNKRYIVLPKDLYTYKANHRYGEAYKGLAQILYPEVFK